MCSFGTYVKLCLLVSQGKLKGMTKFKELTDDYSVLLFVAVVAQSLSHVPTLQPHGLQHSSILHWLSPGVCSNSYLLSWWCYLAISYFVTPFSFYFQSFPASGSIPVSWLFTSGGQSIRASGSASVSPMEYSVLSIRTDWHDLLTVQGPLKSICQQHSSKAWILWHSTFFTFQLSHLYMTTGKDVALTIYIFAGNVMPLLFNTLSRFVIAFLSRRSLTFNDGQMSFWKNSG